MILLLVSPPAVWLGLPVAVLLAAGYLFDSADGQLARLSGRSSKTGSGSTMSSTHSVPRPFTWQPQSRS
ncbi:hypothetical protein QP028_05140 [Corynebacterium suedekumii]|nr:hypothetical protein QP028_05140 [Corynebacterium suedekumii]